MTSKIKVAMTNFKKTTPRFHMRFQKLYFNEKENIPFEREKNEKNLTFEHNCYLNIVITNE